MWALKKELKLPAIGFGGYHEISRRSVCLQLRLKLGGGQQTAPLDTGPYSPSAACWCIG